MRAFFSFREAGKFFKIGFPIFIAQLAQTGMNFADTAMTGQYNAEDMAAVAVAGSIWAPIGVLGIGCLMALPPLTAQLVGGSNREGAAHLLRQGLWITLFISALLILFFQIISWHLGSFGLTESMAELAGSYLRALSWGLPGFMFFVNQRSFYEGFARTRPAMIIGLLGLALNVPCNYILIYGKFGLPAMGAAGCGVASALCFWFMGAAMSFYLRRDKKFADLRPLLSMFRKRTDDGEPEKIFDLPLILRALRVGFPSAIALFFEVSLFALSAILLAPLGTIVVAGNQIAMNFGTILFMIPLALGMTSTIRVGYCIGARKLREAELAAYTGLVLSLVFAVIISALTIYYRGAVVHIYNNDAAVVALAENLLFYLGAYQLLDAAQMSGIGVLRGYNDTRIISLICFGAYWIIGLPLGCVLGRTDFIVPPMGAQGFWISYLFALGFGAVCYWLRIRFLHSLPPHEIFARVGK
ncbi:MAG: MATE family efflux transporter [Desulfovibrio sp.]|nr:MATE family efflux transporter [Desulfovibrio sp.]